MFVWDTAIDAGEVFAAYKDFTNSERRWDSDEVDGDIMIWYSDGRSVILRLEGQSKLTDIAPDSEILDLIAEDFP